MTKNIVAQIIISTGSNDDFLLNIDRPTDSTETSYNSSEVVMRFFVTSITVRRSECDDDRWRLVVISSSGFNITINNRNALF
jgi:hypothetical protein